MTKLFHASFAVLNETFILNEIEESGKNSLPTTAFKDFEFREGLVFYYGYTIKLLLTNQFGPHRKIFEASNLRSKYFPVWTSQLVNKSL